MKCPLSDREKQTMKWIVLGITSNAIGRKMGISPRTVENHVVSMLKKTNTNSRTELVILVLEYGWLEDE